MEWLGPLFSAAPRLSENLLINFGQPSKTMQSVRGVAAVKGEEIVKNATPFICEKQCLLFRSAICDPT